MEKLVWHNEKRKVDDLIPYEQNPRQLTEKQAEDLKNSLDKFGLVEVPAIDLDNKIIAGHQRMKIMQLLGRGQEEIDVRLPNRKLTNEEFREYLIRSNKNTGSFNWDMLANSFNTEDLIAWGFTKFELFQTPDAPDDFNPDNEWKDMPEFVNDDESIYSIKVHFKDKKYVDEFLLLLGQTIRSNQRSIWFPAQEIKTTGDKEYVDEA